MNAGFLCAKIGLPENANCFIPATYFTFYAEKRLEKLKYAGVCDMINASRNAESMVEFNKGCDLQAVVEAYYVRFDFYPAAVLADRIYRTHANRKSRSEHGIRFTGSALGRKIKTDSVKGGQRIYQFTRLM